MKYALIKSGMVKNVVLWDGDGDLFSDYECYEIAEGEEVGSGYAAVKEGGKWGFTAPAIDDATDEQPA